MAKYRVTVVVIVTAILIVLLLGLFMFRSESESQAPRERVQETATAVNLGITYLPVTPILAAYCGLEVDSGALVTEVIPHSSADKAGVKVGDVILSFNGTRLEEGAPLLGMMRACPAGNRIALEIWRGKSIRIVEFIHTER